MTEHPSTPDQPRLAPRPASNVADAIGLFLRGLAIGGIDVIPGVSGGTIALITGIYERFINALRSLSPAFLVPLCQGRMAEARRLFLQIDWRTLIPLGAGILFAILAVSRLIIALMEERPGETYAFLFGLILASAWIPISYLKSFNARNAAALVAAAIAAWLFVGMQTGPTPLRVARHDSGAQTVLYPSKLRTSQDVESVRALAASISGLHPDAEVVVYDPRGILEPNATLDGFTLRRLETEAQAAAYIAAAPPLIVLDEQRASLVWIFICGGLAISAMILPGISGAFLLLFLGQYQAVFSTIHECIGHVSRLIGRAPDPLVAATMHPWYHDFFFIGAFGIGVLVGLAVFSRIVAWLFQRAHDLTMAALTGFMLGALRQPGDFVIRSGSGSSYWTIVVLLGLAGAALVLGLHFTDALLRARRDAAHADA